MNKILQQSLITIGVIASLWLLIAQINWTTLFNVKKNTDETSQKLGDVLWESIEKNTEINTNTYLQQTLDSITRKICNANYIDKSYYKIHIVNDSEINAFALPGGHIIINTGLLKETQTPEELSGVLCHEIAHTELNHIMKSLVKEIGLSILISIATGGNDNIEVISGTVHQITSNTFSRTFESEADLKAIDYLIEANINPEDIANFLYKIANEDSDDDIYESWTSTHPNSKERAEYIINYIKDLSTNSKPVVHPSTWNQLKEEITSE